MNKLNFFTDLGIKYPIIQGAMAWISESSLASAVSNAGGLGIIAGANAPVEYIKEEIRKNQGTYIKALWRKYHASQ